MNEKNDPVTVTEIEPTEKDLDFIENSEGIFLSSEDGFREGQAVLRPETYRFAKWLRQNKPELNVEIDKCENVIDLKSVEIWVPLVFLAKNVALPLFLSCVYDFLKSVVKGRLSEDKPVAHLRVVYKDKDKDKFKEFKYDGPVEGLNKIKQFDIENFMNE